MRRNRRFTPSPTYGTPHPNLEAAKLSAEFSMSIYDAAPKVTRDRAKNDCESDIKWFYALQSDPRPFGARHGIPPDYELPSFPWESSPHAIFMSLFR